jgi:hypothetical protein
VPFSAEPGSGAAALEEWFENGRLVRPNSGEPDILDLVHALADLCGCRRAFNRTENSERLIRDIGEADHYVFVLIDGMGVNLLNLLNKRSFLKKHWVETITTVFPSTTAAVLTSIATGASPADHGLCGWWLYFPRKKVSATILPYVDRFEPKVSLEERGISPDYAFTRPSLLPDLDCEPFTVLPAHIAGSIYSTYSSGGTAYFGYKTIRDGVDAVAENLSRARGPTYTYLYFPQVDSVCHKRGWRSGKVRRVLLELDDACRHLCSSAGGKTRIIISADHGFSNISSDRQYLLRPGDPFLKTLECPPTGNESTPVFHVKDGSEGAFREQFARRFGRDFVLLSREDADRLRLFGRGPMSDGMKRHAGDFIGLAPETAALCFCRDETSHSDKKAVHSALLPAEMKIPLIMA